MRHIRISQPRQARGSPGLMPTRYGVAVSTRDPSVAPTMSLQSERDETYPFHSDYSGCPTEGMFSASATSQTGGSCAGQIQLSWKHHSLDRAYDHSQPAAAKLHRGLAPPATLCTCICAASLRLSLLQVFD